MGVNKVTLERLEAQVLRLTDRVCDLESALAAIKNEDRELPQQKNEDSSQPCPHCDHKPFIIKKEGMSQVDCSFCWMRGPASDKEEEAIKFWDLHGDHIRKGIHATQKNYQRQILVEDPSTAKTCKNCKYSKTVGDDYLECHIGRSVRLTPRTNPPVQVCLDWEEGSEKAETVWIPLDPSKCGGCYYYAYFPPGEETQCTFFNRRPGPLTPKPAKSKFCPGRKKQSQETCGNCRFSKIYPENYLCVFPGKRHILNPHRKDKPLFCPGWRIS